MKTTYFILLTLFIGFSVSGAAPISVDEFKKMNPVERKQAIQQASPEQKEELGKVDLHLTLLQQWGGEAGLKTQKETCAACARGLCFMEGAFIVYLRIWDGYVGSVWQANEKAGMTQGQLEEAAGKLRKEENMMMKRLPIIHSLVFHMAASPKALELDKRAEQLCIDLNKEFGLDGSTPYHAPTRDELMKVKKQMDQIFEEMKTLPTLPPGQVQKEYDAFPEKKIVSKIHTHQRTQSH